MTALVTMLVSTCSSRTASPSTHTGSVLMSMCRSSRASPVNGGDGPAYRLGHVERLPIQPDLAGDHALDVEQIVDQMGDVADLPRDHLVRAASPASSAACVSSSTRTALLIAPSGLRSSWASIARNSSFVRLSRSARSRLLLASSSSREIRHDQIQAIAVGRHRRGERQAHLEGA